MERQTPKFNREVIENAAKNMLIKYDFNKNGILDPREILHMVNVALVKMNKKPYAKFADVSELMKVIDTNKDDKISLTEL